jgi:predicted MFS family arabinose efflux permease
MDRKTSNTLAYVMWLLPLSFFTYQFILRLFPSLIMQQILIKFQVDATAFGILASVYYYGYAGFQIPVAVLLDRYKPRYVIFTSVLMCSLATLTFSITDNWYLLLLSRLLVGSSSAVAFLGVSKIVTLWFKPESYAKIIGFSFTIGLTGAIYGGMPTNILIEQMGWQKVGYILAFVAFVISVLILLFLRTPKTIEDSQKESGLKISDFKNLMRSKTIWLLGASSLLMVGSLEGFADIWGVNYLMTAYTMSKSEAAELTSFIFFGMLFGGPVLAFCAKKYGNYNVLIACALLMSVAFSVLLSCKTGLNYTALAVLFWFLGILCCYQVIIFSSGAEIITDVKLLGVTIAFLNSINMLGGSFFHSAIGFIMDKFWSGIIINDVRQYELASYDIALIIIPICSFIGALLLLMIKRNRCC